MYFRDFHTRINIYPHTHTNTYSVYILHTQRNIILEPLYLERLFYFERLFYYYVYYVILYMFINLYVILLELLF